MSAGAGAVVVRPVRRTELVHLQALEDAADRLLLDALQPDSWQPAPDGRARAAEPGFILVALVPAGHGPAGHGPVGFAHVIERDGLAHLEQLSVHPDHARQGCGRALVEAAKRTAAGRGHRRMTLRTDADLPWNAPFSRSCGFADSTPDTAFLRDLVDVERRLGLDRHGRRIQMTARLHAPPSAP